jgi:hypothetical protein
LVHEITVKMSMDPVMCQPTTAHGLVGYSRWIVAVVAATVAHLGLEVPSIYIRRG